MTAQPEQILARRKEILGQILTILAPGQTKNAGYQLLGRLLGKNLAIFYTTTKGTARLQADDIEKLKSALQAELDKPEVGELVKPLIEALLQEREDELDLRCLTADIKAWAKSQDDKGGDSDEQEIGLPRDPEAGAKGRLPTSIVVRIGDDIITLRRGGVLLFTLTSDGKLIIEKS